MNIVVGITGGIAAYKAVGVVRALVLEGHDVHVVATDAALRFVGRPTLEAISRNPVHSDLYEGVAEVRHVALGQRADLIVIAPATAHTLAKLATGLADDLLGNTVLASTAPLVLAPAMHTEMWQNPATDRERGAAGRARRPHRGPRERAAHRIRLGAGAHGGARRDRRRRTRPASAPRDLAGRRILITAGGTREPLDPVRFIGNRSSGKQGVALARAAAARGAEVTLVVAQHRRGRARRDGSPASRSSTYPPPSSCRRRRCSPPGRPTPSSWPPRSPTTGRSPSPTSKIKKDAQGDTLDLHLVKNPDILMELTAARRDGQVVVGFAAETEADRDALLALGRAKAARKGVDFLVVNRVGWTEGFAADGNAVVVLSATGDIVAEAEGSKASVADRILDVVR